MLTGLISLVNIKEVSNSFSPCIESYSSVFWFTEFVLLCFRGLFHLVNSDSVVLMSLTTAIASNSTVFSDIITSFFCTYTTLPFILIVMAVLLLFSVASNFLELGIKDRKYVKICIQHKHKILILVFLMSSKS